MIEDNRMHQLVSKSRRKTRQRQVILEKLRSVTSHPTASQLYDMVRRELPHVSLGTIYRNLDVLVQDDEIQKLEFGGEARFDGNARPHFHVRCVHCDKVDDIHDMPEEMMRREFKRLGGYAILGHRCEFIGVCPCCQARLDRQQGETDQPAGDGHPSSQADAPV